MATVNKDFKIKSGLIVEGTTATVNGYDILTKKQDDQDYIIGLIGGAADSAATPDTVVLRDGDANFAANNVTVNTLYVGGTTNNGIDVVDGDTEVGSNNGILLSASSDIALNSNNGDIVLNPDGLAYYGGKSSNNEIATRGYVDGEISSLDTAAQGYADAAETAANGYTDSAISTEVTNRNSAISTAKGEAISSSNGYTDSAISTEVTNRNSAISTAKGEAISDANDYTDSAISTEVSNRNSAISTAITNLDLANTYDALGAADQALSDANYYTDNRETAITTAYQNYADQAETDAITTANAYADQKVADLVDAAPALLDTLNELAAALGDDSDFIGTVNAAIGEKVSKAGDILTGDLNMSSNKVTSLGAPTANGDAANKLYVDNATSQALSDANDYTDGEISTLNTTAQGYATTAENNAKGYADSLASNYDAAGAATTAYNNAVSYTDGEISSLDTAAQGYATTAENNAKGYADSLAVNYDPSGSAATAEGNANGYTDSAINALDTDDIEEGANNLYFTDNRASNAAATLLTNASTTNITITGDSVNGLVITAENGVADSTTDDLEEGDNNLYFTDERAIDALSGVTIWPEAVVFNNLAKQVAATTEVATASTITAYSWAKADYRTAKFLVKTAYGTHTDVAEVLLTLDTSDNIAITEYAMVGTNGSAMTISADVSGNDVRLRIATVNNNSTVTVVGTLLA